MTGVSGQRDDGIAAARRLGGGAPWLLLFAVLAGCVTYEETRTEPVDPHAPVRAAVRAASTFYFEHERWPRSPAELEAFSYERPGAFSAEGFRELAFSPAPGGLLEIRWATEPPRALEGRLTLRPPVLSGGAGVEGN